MCALQIKQQHSGLRALFIFNNVTTKKRRCPDISVLFMELIFEVSPLENSSILPLGIAPIILGINCIDLDSPPPTPFLRDAHMDPVLFLLDETVDKHLKIPG